MASSWTRTRDTSAATLASRRQSAAAYSKKQEAGVRRILLDTSTPRPLRRSTPEFSINSSSDKRASQFEDGMKTTNDDYQVPYSRSFTGRTSSGYSKIHSVDTKNAQLYLRRHSSRTSLHSSTSTGLVVSDNASSASSSQSRPVSADADSVATSLSQSTVIDTVIQSKSISHPHSAAATTNTRVVLPNPPSSTGRIIPLTNRSMSIPSLVAPNRHQTYLDKLVCQICDYIYMSDIEAAYNANLLCRLNIEYVIDVSNVEPLKVPRHKRSDCPCLCPLTTAHSRVRMTMTIEENSCADLIPYFDDVNRFIDSARKCNKRVLIHSFNGRNRCAVLVVQYLMKARKLHLEKAMTLLKSMRPDVSIGENFLKSLRKWELLLQRQRSGSDETDDLSSNVESFKLTNDVRPFIGSFADRKLAQGGTPVAKRSAWI